jgi:hypothetical protein
LLLHFEDVRHLMHRECVTSCIEKRCCSV